MLTKLPALFPWKHNKTKIMAEQLQTMEEAVNLELDLLPCVICGRTFLPAPLEKHTKVCEKNATRKRKVFDSLKQRVEGTDLAPFHQKSYLKKNEVAATQKIESRQSKWKEKHLELVNAIRAAKGVTPTSMPSMLAKRSSTTLGTPTHERCPSCDRQFGPKAFDRHVEWCKEKKTTIHKSPASVLLAKERLEARTKYKVPPLTKSKRALNREKYSPQTNNRTESVVNIKSVSACALDRSASIRRSTKNQLNRKKSPEKMNESGSNQVEQESHFGIREKLERSSGEPGVKVVHSEKSFNNKDVRKFVEPMKSVNKRLPFSKINTISVNDDVEGLTVSSLSLGETDTRKLVTWKDTLKMSKSENTPFVAKNKLASPEKLNNRIKRDGGSLKMETFSNLATQSKNRKGENNFKVVVKEKKPQDSSNRVPLKRIDPGQSPSNLTKIGSENLKIVDPDKSRRLPAGGNFQKDPIKININMIDSGSSIDGFTLTSDSGELTITNPISSSLITFTQSQTDTDDKLGSEAIDNYFENFTPHQPMPIESDEMVFKDSTEAILYDENLDADDYKNEIATLKLQLNALESRSYTNWQDKFVEGQAYGRSPRRGKKSGRSRSATVKNSRKNSAKKQNSKSSSKCPSPQLKLEIKPKSVRSANATPRASSSLAKNSGKETQLSPNSKIPNRSRKNSPNDAKSNELTAWKRNQNSPNKSFKSSSDAVLIKKDCLKRKAQAKKDLYSPKSADVTLRLSLTTSRPTTPSSGRHTSRLPVKRQEQTSTSKMGEKKLANPKVVSPISKRIDKAISKGSGQTTPTTKTAKKVLPKLSDEITQLQLSTEAKKKLPSNQNNLKISSTSSNEYIHTHCYFHGYTSTDDEIVTQYERCKAQCKANSLEKVHTKDIGVSCLTKYRRDTKIVNCERFLERNKLISMDLKSPPSSSEDTDTYVFPDKLVLDKCCQTSSIESILKMSFAENIARNKREARRRNSEDERAIGVNRLENRNEAYFDSLDESSGSVGSEVFKDDNTPAKDATPTGGATAKPPSSKKSLKAKSSKSNMLYQRSSEDGFSEDSVVDGCENYHSHALSVSRIERGLRKCSSDVCLRQTSDTIFASSCTEVDLRKLASYECTSIRSGNKYEDVNLTSDEILEIAGEQFLQCLRNNSQIKTSTPISQRKAPFISECPPSLNVTECVFMANTSKRIPPVNVIECPPSLNVSDCVPSKKRKLEKSSQEIVEPDQVGVKKDKGLDTELRRNIEQIKEKKEKFQNLIEDRNFKELVRNSSVFFANNPTSSEDDLVLNIEVSENSSENIEMKRILSTIQEASSNTSSGVTNKFPSNYNFASGGDNRNKINRYADIARDMGFGYLDHHSIANRSEVREANLIDFNNDDSCNVPNRFLFLPSPHEILQPVRLSYFSPRRDHLKQKTQNTLTDLSSPDLSPRFLHLVRTIIHPPQLLGRKDMCGDVEEEFLKISRAHCRKLLQLDMDKLNHILESEPLKLPKITTASTVRGCTDKLKKKAVVKLPPVQNNAGVKSPAQARVKNSPSKGRRPLARPDLCKARIPIRGNKAEFYNSEPDLLESKTMADKMRFALTPRPNSSYTKSTTITTETNTKNINDYNPFVSAERQLMELLECDDFLNTPPAPPPTIHSTPRPRTTDTAVNSNKTVASKSSAHKKKVVKSANPKLQKEKIENSAAPKRASVIDPPVDFRDRLSMLNDDFDAIENMINTSYSNGGNEPSYTSKFYAKAENNSFNLNAILSRRKYSDDLSIIDPRLINENDNLSIPESLHNDDSSPSSMLDNNYFDLGNRYDDVDQFSENFDNKMSSIEPDGTEIKLKQSISLYDDDKFIGSGNIDEFVIALSESNVDNKSKPKKQIKSSKLPKSTTEKSNSLENSSIGYGGNSKDRKKNNLASLKRSISLLDPVQKPKTLKNKQDVQNYFNEQEFKSPTKPEKNLGKIETSPVRHPDESNRFVPKAEDLFSVDDEMYEEYKKYEEMYLKEKEEKLKKEERRISDGQSGLLTASEDDESQQQSVKLSGDSAYGSLNRKTPKVRARSTKLTPLDSQRNLTAESPNSSSSESSPVIPSTSPVAPKMSKFCHECGNRYPVTSAKFCVECGVKRLVL